MLMNVNEFVSGKEHVRNKARSISAISGNNGFISNCRFVECNNNTIHKRDIDLPGADTKSYIPGQFRSPVKTNGKEEYTFNTAMEQADLAYNLDENMALYESYVRARKNQMTNGSLTVSEQDSINKFEEELERKYIIHLSGLGDKLEQWSFFGKPDTSIKGISSYLSTVNGKNVVRANNGHATGGVQNSYSAYILSVDDLVTGLFGQQNRAVMTIKNWEKRQLNVEDSTSGIKYRDDMVRKITLSYGIQLVEDLTRNKYGAIRLANVKDFTNASNTSGTFYDQSLRHQFEELCQSIRTTVSAGFGLSDCHVFVGRKLFTQIKSVYKDSINRTADIYTPRVYTDNINSDLYSTENKGLIQGLSTSMVISQTPRIVVHYSSALDTAELSI